jgi:hypothetical protein
MKASYGQIIAGLGIWLSVNVALIAMRLLATAVRSNRGGAAVPHRSRAHLSQLRLVGKLDRWRPPSGSEETTPASGRKRPST